MPDTPTRTSRTIENCQFCGSDKLDPVLFLGYQPPVNRMRPIGSRPDEQVSYPAQLLHCRACDLVQLGLAIDRAVLFPPNYPYTSGTTRVLRDNFAELCREATGAFDLKPGDLVIDIGSNDGTLLSNFLARGQRVLGIEPTDVGALARDRGVDTVTRFFDRETARDVRASHGPARLLTAANVFAHIDDVHMVVDGVRELLADDGVFVSESHYLFALIDTLQYDTVY